MYEYVYPDRTGKIEQDVERLYDALADICKQLNYDIGLGEKNAETALSKIEQYKRDIFPVGHVLIQADDTDPNQYFYGTWERIGAGKCLVGKDPSDTDFDTSGKTGGSKGLQAHTHDLTCENLPLGKEDLSGSAGYAVNQSVIDLDKTVAVKTAGTGNSGNLQPYLVVNFWKRME